jgi:GDP-D-mannose 3', 5'-epimerase
MGNVVLVAGAGGFIGGQLVRDLIERGVSVRAVDRKSFKDWYFRSPEAENIVADLQDKSSCYRITEGTEQVYNFAADMGGMGFIEHNKALCMLSVLTNTHLLMASRDTGVRRFFFASSACVYPDYRQQDAHVPGLKESDAYPAMPEDGYGWEKLFQRAYVQALPRRFRSRDPCCALSQCLRPVRDLGRRPRESARRD